jgi:hypothetical protein
VSTNGKPAPKPVDPATAALMRAIVERLNAVRIK